MKLENAKITILIGSDKTTIELHDTDAGIQFMTIELTPNQLSQALSRISHTPCKMSINGIERIGKVMEMDKIEFECNGLSRYSNLDEIVKLGKKNTPDGWICDNYYGSQTSFFTKSGKQHARATIRRWVDKLHANE